MRPTAFLLVLPLAACSLGGGSGGSGSGDAIAGSGGGTTRSYPVADFTGVTVRGSDDVDVRVGKAFSVRAEGPASELDKLRIVRDGDTLEIGRRNIAGWNWGDHAKVTVYVTMPRIDAAASAGSGNLQIDRAEGQRFSGSITGSGHLNVATLAVREATLSIAGSGDVSANGSVGSLAVNVAGSGDVKAAGLKGSSADVAVQGSGSVTADVSGPAKVAVMGSGDVDLGKGAKCTTTKMGSGSVRCGG